MIERVNNPWSDGICTTEWCIYSSLGLPLVITKDHDSGANARVDRPETSGP